MSWRAGDSGGSRRFLGLPLRTEIRIPAPEGILPLFVEHPSSYLQEEMCSLLAPSHLLFLHHPLAHDLIDGRLDETGSDLFPVAIAFPVIGHEVSPVAWQHINLYGRYEFRQQPVPVDVEEIVRELADVQIETDSTLAA